MKKTPKIYRTISTNVTVYAGDGDMNICEYKMDGLDISRDLSGI